jgi:hypothetical protein
MKELWKKYFKKRELIIYILFLRLGGIRCGPWLSNLELTKIQGKAFQDWGYKKEEMVGLLKERGNCRQERKDGLQIEWKDGVNNRKEKVGIITERKG